MWRSGIRFGLSVAAPCVCIGHTITLPHLRLAQCIEALDGILHAVLERGREYGNDFRAPDMGERIFKWARLDLNQRPRDYESPALAS